MLPVIAILGRPNVGKSSLFNRLTGTREALVADTPGVTRDRLVGRGEIGARTCLLIDTGGLGGDDPDFAAAVEAQAFIAAGEADALVLLTDARAGLHGQDSAIAQRLRVLGKPIVLALNKAEGLEPAVLAEFSALGLGEGVAVSAVRGSGIGELTTALEACLPAEQEAAADEPEPPPLLAVIGRPNAGKSTLINRLTGDERVIASPLPGTTRDRVQVPLRYGEQDWRLLDTPGVRRPARVAAGLEQLSVVQALTALDTADLSILLLDATVGPGEQDARLGAYAARHARAVMLGINKSDLLDARERRALAAEVERVLPFLAHAPRRLLSARSGEGVGGLMAEAAALHERAGRVPSTAELTRLVEDLVRRNPPPLSGTWRPRLRYAHTGGRRPLTVVIHGSRLSSLPRSYLLYLENGLRRALDLRGVPLRIVLRHGENPYVPGSGRRR